MVFFSMIVDEGWMLDLPPITELLLTPGQALALLVAAAIVAQTCA